MNSKERANYYRGLLKSFDEMIADLKSFADEMRGEEEIEESAAVAEELRAYLKVVESCTDKMDVAADEFINRLESL